MLNQNDDINQLFTEIRGYVRNVVRRKVPESDVEDVTQYICMHVWRSFDSFKGNSSLKTWINAVAYNRIGDWHRHREYEQRCQLNAQDWQRTATKVAPQKASRWDDMNMDAAVDRLADDQRSVIRELLDDKSLANIARERQVAYPKIRSLYRRGVKNMRARVS